MSRMQHTSSSHTEPYCSVQNNIELLIASWTVHDLYTLMTGMGRCLGERHLIIIASYIFL